MYFSLLIYFNTNLLQVSNRLSVYRRKYFTVHVAYSIYLAFTLVSSSCICSNIPPDDWQLIYSKHVEDYYWNKLREKRTLSCLILNLNHLRNFLSLTMKGFHFVGAGMKGAQWHREKSSITSSPLILSMFREVEYSKIFIANTTQK